MVRLLLVSLGPIQDFIASARRCQDLWFGSWLLSELSRATAQACGASGAVVFPATTDAVGRERPGVANKILVRLDPDRPVEEAVAAARAAYQERLRDIAAAVFASLADEPVHLDVAQAQLDELMEFLWVCVDEPAGPDGYDQARRLAEERLAALKNTRSWGPPAWTARAGLGVPKDSLDGTRESVIDERVYGSAWSDARRREVFGLKGAERLCGVGLLKRLGTEFEPGDEPDVDAPADPAPRAANLFGGARPSFHSTSHAAVLPVVERIEAARSGRAAARRYLRALQDLGLKLGRFRVPGPRSFYGFDGSLLLPSRLDDHFREAVPAIAERRARVRDARAALHALLAEVGAPSEPCPYYAFLIADGDRMGKAIDAIPTLAGHRELGEALDAFSAQCQGIVGEHRGSLVFAGGDDVLALLPLHRALACARALAAAFAELVQPVVDRRWRPRSGGEEKPVTTLSVGLAVAHCREPMGEARALARRAEKAAKRQRNALGLVVAKRSGGDLLLTGSWDAPTPLDARLAQWAALDHAGDLSSKTAHDLEQLAAHYETVRPEDQAARSEEIASLVRGVLARKRRAGGDERLSGPVLDRLMAGLIGEETPAARLRALSAELQVARLFGRAARGASDASPRLVAGMEET